MKKFGTIASAAMLILIILACSPSSQNESESSSEILADCFIDFNLSAWDDLDGDGLWDTSEPPLEGVTFQINGRFASVLIKYPYISDENGQCIIRTWAPGFCNAGDYSITAVPPESFKPTTPNSITLSLTSADFSQEAQFGFTATIK